MGAHLRPLRTLAAAATSLLIALPGCGSGEDPPNANSPQAKAAMARYHAFLDGASEELAEATRRLKLKIEGDERNKAQSRYAASRVFYGQVLPAVVALGDLDSQIDPLADEVPAAQFGGFHRLEQALWEEHSTAGMVPVARRLYADVLQAQRELKTADFPPPQLAAATEEVLGDLAKTSAVGEEERYSHIDLVDVSARMEGTEAANEAVKPPLREADEGLAEEVDAAFAAASKGAGLYGTRARDPEQSRPREPGIAFVIFTELADSAVRKVSDPIAALAELYSEVPPALS
jgi:iron uptake system component EfeO